MQKMPRPTSLIPQTSYWINFFTSSGIPAGDATHYAIIFCDNRITRDMLLDLSKEYLTDMGISRLGDVIAILKHAKEVFNQEARDKVMKSTALSLESSSHSASPRRSTAASRMVNHFTGKHPEAAPMKQSPVPKLPPPDPPRPKRKVSVFERLGADDLQATVSLPSGNNTAGQNSVFSRLGGKAGIKRVASSTSLEDLDHLIDNNSSLPYAGVLKNSPSPAKKANIKVAVSRPQIKMKKITKTVKIEDEKASNIQRPEISTTTEGVLSDHAKKDSLTLRDRLGRKSKMETPSSTSSAKSGQPKFMTNPKQKTKQVTALKKRLGSRKADSPSSPIVSSSAEKSSVEAKRGGMLSDTVSKPSGAGVFSRLGKKTT
ncbi:hypothetical protein EGW08_012350 [Elysia chlorotica]|uniref:SAM domain-containing protein n=1 Tax=Elysia chlorotica TaxID=188477 RepID=A0A433TE83_ELYCH|nr:hypothetical protein EGW08_012350 [Elysia chlorotica]